MEKYIIFLNGFLKEKQKMYTKENNIISLYYNIYNEIKMAAFLPLI